MIVTYVLQRNSRYVALKILVSKLLGSTTELRTLRHITEVAPVEGTRYITQLLDEFEHHGPNGVHQGLGFEPMGSSVNTMVEELIYDVSGKNAALGMAETTPTP
ncbi:Serine protein kinase, putative [Penicillium digitatum]|uniref:Uncharacterized protein n=3 Tax=Penicillium digitatum TaxID=36651 RepID=K9FPZ2_PEND2|nr:hypothetical protein PDIP_66510 [Penicillium digitatum Pd1]EKV09140.1 hypothetical protein PDIP_66510 [Penicillium digitatum Pd1]EKV10407.1 hypothetical protein PDIG_56960 [Penicillium digitatum PHI26]KAG0158572.1 hypothetical protein PDIDSM_6087 [Penicillium digitatum]QQK41934.1 Serine protein kinase, putative [Penicillium digitatum]